MKPSTGGRESEPFNGKSRTGRELHAVTAAILAGDLRQAGRRCAARAGSGPEAIACDRHGANANSSTICDAGDSSRVRRLCMLLKLLMCKSMRR